MIFDEDSTENPIENSTENSTEKLLGHLSTTITEDEFTKEDNNNNSIDEYSSNDSIIIQNDTTDTTVVFNKTLKLLFEDINVMKVYLNGNESSFRNLQTLFKNNNINVHIEFIKHEKGTRYLLCNKSVMGCTEYGESLFNGVIYEYIKPFLYKVCCPAPYPFKPNRYALYDIKSYTIGYPSSKLFYYYSQLDQKWQYATKRNADIQNDKFEYHGVSWATIINDCGFEHFSPKENFNLRKLDYKQAINYTIEFDIYHPCLDPSWTSASHRVCSINENTTGFAHDPFSHPANFSLIGNSLLQYQVNGDNVSYQGNRVKSLVNSLNNGLTYSNAFCIKYMTTDGYSIITQTKPFYYYNIIYKVPLENIHRDFIETTKILENDPYLQEERLQNFVKHLNFITFKPCFLKILYFRFAEIFNSITDRTLIYEYVNDINEEYKSFYKKYSSDYKKEGDKKILSFHEILTYACSEGYLYEKLHCYTYGNNKNKSHVNYTEFYENKNLMIESRYK